MKKAFYILLGIVGTVFVMALTVLLAVFFAGIGAGLTGSETLPTWAVLIMVASPFLSGILFAVKWFKKMKTKDFK